MIICVGRQLGAMGCEVAQKLAKDLGLKYYDTELINLAAERCGFNPHIFENQDERHGLFHTLFSSLAGRIGLSHGDVYGSTMSQESLFQIQSEAIWHEAKASPQPSPGGEGDQTSNGCVFVGRCADYVLRNKPDMFSVFITANKEDRIKVVSEKYGCDRSTAEKFLERKEAERASYYNYYTSKQWGAAESYDLCINSSLLGVEKTAEYIEEIINRVKSLRV